MFRPRSRAENTGHGNDPSIDIQFYYLTDENTELIHDSTLYTLLIPKKRYVVDVGMSLRVRVGVSLLPLCMGIYVTVSVLYVLY